MISDRTLLNLSSKMSEPLCEGYRYLRYGLVTPLVFCDSLTNEIARRTIIGLGAALARALIYTFPLPVIAGVAFLGLSSKVLRALGFALQTRGFTHALGQAQEKTLTKDLKLMTWNICGLAGGFSLDHGGVLPWRERFEAIIETIKTEDPDLLILQEVVDTDLAEAIIEKLKSDYAHFFMHLGDSIWGVGSGGMILSKCAVHDFSFTSFANKDWKIHRGFATLEIKTKPEDEKPCIRILGTHLLHGRPDVAHEGRMQQVAQMLDFVAKKTLALPTVIAGDLNIERDKEDGKALKSILHHAYVGLEPTCTDQFLAKWSQEAALQFPEETIDYISFVKDQPPLTFQNVHIVPAFEEDVRTARSDHHALVADILL